MSAGTEFLIGLLERSEPVLLTWEDFRGEHGGLLRACQGAGFLGRRPLIHPVPGCPHCGEGVPYRLGRRHLCNRCRSEIDPRHLLCWRLDPDAFAAWLARGLRVRGTVRRVEERLWHLGTWGQGEGHRECFYQTAGPLSERGAALLAAYRDALVLHGLMPPESNAQPGRRCLSLAGLLRTDGTLTVAEPGPLLGTRGTVRFDAHSGALWVGDTWLGEVPPGSKEHHLLGCLAEQPDRFVPYANLKRHVLRAAGSRDETEEATFCQGLKSRIKRKWVQRIDRLIATTNKGDGYRLRGYAELS